MRVLFVLILLAPWPARAFDIFPEFHALSEDEQIGFDRVYEYDAEYQSDVQTYLMPFRWDSEFNRSDKSFQGSLGSLSNKIFLQHNRLKLRSDLNGDTQVRITYFDQRDLDVDQTHFVVEIVKKITPWFSLSLYGEPSHFKRQNDIGFAALIHPSATHEVRIFHTWVDFTRNQHNDRPDYFKEPRDPRSIGLVGRCFGCLGNSDDFLEYFVRQETPTTWNFPQTESEYAYENQVIGAKARTILDSDALNFRTQFSRKFEGVTGGSTSAVATRSLDRRILEIDSTYELNLGELFGAPSSITPGIAWIHRHWRDQTNAFLEHRNLVGTLWIQRDVVSLGYDAIWFGSTGDASVRPPELKFYTVQHRLNLRYAIKFSESAELSILGSADADEGGTFEGGQGMFKSTF